jgi:hypothetical protein
MNGYNPYQQYNYGYPNSYGNRTFLPPQQMVQPQSQQPMQFEMPIQDVRFVTSEEAKAFIVMPNRNALLIDKLNGMAHFKFADGLGQSATQCFKFEQVNIDGTPVKEQETPPKIDYSQFATVAQYNDLLSKFNSLSEAVSNMKQQKGENKPVARDLGVDKGNTHQVRQQA